MEISRKKYFWEALVISVIIFGLGIFLGYMLELNRTSSIISVYQQSELDMLDIKIQENILAAGTFDCNKFFNETIDFANRIYDEAQSLQKFEDSSTLTSGLIQQHEKYDLLRATLWMNSISLKQKCQSKFSTVVYFYSYNTKDIDLKSKQAIFSNELSILKQNYGDKLVLIPIAGDLGLNSIDILKNEYNITQYPTILINEKTKIEQVVDLPSLDDYFK